MAHLTCPRHRSGLVRRGLVGPGAPVRCGVARGRAAARRRGVLGRLVALAVFGLPMSGVPISGLSMSGLAVPGLAITASLPAHAQEPPAAEPPAAERPAAGAPAAEATAGGELPRDLTPFGMFAAADIVVKGVMLGLILASVLTWTIWLAKSLELMAARRALGRAAALLARARSFDDVADAAAAASRHVGLLILAASDELQRSSGLRDVEGIKERVAARCSRAEAAVGRQMMRATGIIATIGATAPFVGLFGTVWGIMNSFIGISKLHTTNLAVVAPGIAEALLATACGLAAAIPAVVIYNAFARSITHYRGVFADASVEVQALLGRDLTRPHAAPPERARPAPHIGVAR